MSFKKKSAKRKKGGRPATGTDPFVGLRVPRQLLTKIDAWASKGGAGTRSEAIRRLVEKALPAAQAKSAESRTKKTAKATKLAEEQVDRMIDPALAPEERERSKRRLIKGPGEFREIRNRSMGKREK
jgi:Arc/MetJ-type ribon-helix-helix transcriptional regulator